MYEFIMWMCLVATPECPVWESAGHQVRIYKFDSRYDCEAQWKTLLKEPDPDGLVSRHKCQPIEDAI